MKQWLYTEFASKPHPTKLYTVQLFSCILRGKSVSDFRVIHDQKCKMFFNTLYKSSRGILNVESSTELYL